MEVLEDVGELKMDTLTELEIFKSAFKNALEEMENIRQVCEINFLN